MFYHHVDHKILLREQYYFYEITKNLLLKIIFFQHSCQKNIQYYFQEPLLQKEEGAPVSAILCEIGTDMLVVSVLRAGKILETKRVPIQQSIPHTIDKTLHAFTDYEILPSRIVVFNEKTHTKLSQE